MPLNLFGICLGIGLIVSLSNIIFLYNVAPHFIDFTDEGFYLNLISDPYAFDGRVTRFAELISWLFHWLSGNLVSFRRIVLSALVLISFAFTLFSIRLNRQVLSRVLGGRKNYILNEFTLAFVISNLSLFAVWPSLTPSYNYINYLSMLLFGVLLLRLDSELPAYQQNSWIFSLNSGFLLSLPLVLIAYAKPTSYLLLALSVIVVCLFASTQLRKILYISLGLSVVIYLICALLFFGGDSNLLTDLQFSLYIIGTWKADSEASITDYSFFSSLLRLIPNKTNLASFLFASAFAFFTQNTTRCRARLTLIFISILSIFLSLFLWFSANVYLPLISDSCKIFNNYFAQFLLPFIGFYFLSSIIFDFNPISSIRRLFRFKFAAPFIDKRLSNRPNDLSRFSLGLPQINNTHLITALLVVLPCAFAFSSTNGFVAFASLGSLFIVLAFFRIINSCFLDTDEVLRSSHPNYLFVSILLIPLLICLQLTNVFSVCPFPPGYQRALSEQQVSTAISSNTTLFLSKERSTYVDSLRSVLSSAGFHNGNHILDLTGNSPGLVYAVGGKAIGWPWIHDVYPNSTRSNQILGFYFYLFYWF